jgi:glycosyltransferase involved in cell wall biosynthesis
MGLDLLRGLAALDDRLTIKVLVNGKTNLPPDLLARDHLLFCPAPWDPRGAANQLFLPPLLKKLGVKVLHSIDAFAPLAGSGLRRVITVHDLIPLVCQPLMPDCVKSRHAFLWKTWLNLQCGRAARVVTVSNHSAGDIARLLRVGAGKLRVIYNPVREWTDVEPLRRFRQRFGLAGRVISYVGRQDPYKNLVTLVRALPLILRALPEDGLRLVVAGSEDTRYPQARAEAVRQGIPDRVVFTGYLADDSLGALYQTSDVFVFPSLYEGFGMPPVEAMRFGVPVVAGRLSASPEVLGNAPLYVDMRDPQALATGVVTVLKNRLLALRLQAAGLRQAALYSSRHAALLYRGLYEELLAPTASPLAA